MAESGQQISESVDRGRGWGWVVRTLLVLITAAAIVLCFPSGKTTEYAHLAVGSIVPEEIIAPFDFEVLKNPSELEQERLQARQSVNPVFVRDDSVTVGELGRFERLWSSILSISARASQDTASAQSAAELLRDSLKSEPSLSMDMSGWRFISQIAADHVKSREFIQPVRQILRDIYARGILSMPVSRIGTPDGKIALLERGEESLVDLKEFYMVGTAKVDLLGRLKTVFGANVEELDSLKVAYNLLTPFLRPNIVMDQRETERRRVRAVSQVPTVKGLVLKNERVVDSNVRLTQDDLDKIRSLEAKSAELVRVKGGFQFVAPIVGRAILVLGLLLLSGAILYSLGYNVVGDLRRLLLMVIILLLTVVAGYSLIHHANLSPVYLPIAATVMLASFLFNITVALTIAVAASIFIAAVAGYDFSVLILCLFPSLVAVLAVQGTQTRTGIMKAAIPLGIAYVLSIAVLHLLKYSFGVEALTEMGIGLANALFSPIVAMGLLIPFEYLSGITTDLTLLELSDLNRPLLRKLALEAPGTYHHAIMVGNLSEAAAESIGANPLLVRVASYYHDIGKMDIKEYFIENQSEGENAHDLLSPEMSASILKDHVTRGLALAKKYRLPQVVRDFIPQHHGTNLIPYFYHKALKQGDSVEVDEQKYRYPGPKPMSREAAVVMLADIVEATTRALKDPDAEDIEKAVDESIETRLQEGQLDDSELTLSDIRKIKEAFVRVLRGAIHQRIEYPGKNDIKREQSRETETTAER
jgi:putative nucleotidyltransferase with HDIG domain